MKTLLTAVAAVAALLASSCAPAYAADPITVTAPNVDITTNSCFPGLVSIGGLTEKDHPYVVSVIAPNGDYAAGSTWNGNSSYAFTVGVCSSMLEGRYAVLVDGVEYGGFTAFKPVLEPVSGGSARRHHAQVSSALLTIHGAPMAGRAVTVRTKVRGHRHAVTRTLSTNAAGRVPLHCPKHKRCTVTVSYDNGWKTFTKKLR